MPKLPANVKKDCKQLKRYWQSKILLKAFLSFFFILEGCGYHLHTVDPISLSIPYATGDTEQILTSALVRKLSTSSHFSYAAMHEGEWILQVKLLGKSQERVGFRYDQSNSPGYPLKKNLVGTEDRKKITAIASVIDAKTGKEVLSSQIFTATTDYDYVNSSSLEDLSFIVQGTGGKRVTSLNTSLGELDGIDQASLNANLPLYEKLAEKIIEGIGHLYDKTYANK